MQLNSGASLNLDAYNLAVGSMAGAAPINLSTHTLTAGGDNTDSSYSGPISGNGTLIKTGTGDLALSGSDSYLGLTTISAGNWISLARTHGILSRIWVARIFRAESWFLITRGSTDPYTTIVGLSGTKIYGSMPLAVMDDVVNSRVIVSAVPEPSAIALLGVGTVASLLMLGNSGSEGSETGTKQQHEGCRPQVSFRRVCRISAVFRFY